MRGSQPGKLYTLPVATVCAHHENLMASDRASSLLVRQSWDPQPPRTGHTAYTTANFLRFKWTAMSDFLNFCSNGIYSTCQVVNFKHIKTNLQHLANQMIMSTTNCRPLSTNLQSPSLSFNFLPFLYSMNIKCEGVKLNFPQWNCCITILLFINVSKCNRSSAIKSNHKTQNKQNTLWIHKVGGKLKVHIS